MLRGIQLEQTAIASMILLNVNVILPLACKCWTIFDWGFGFMSRVFLFDIDGTLLDSGQAGQAAMEETLQLEFGVEKLEYDIPTAGRTDRAIICDLLASHDLEADGERLEKFQQRYFTLLSKHLDLRGGCILTGVEKLLDLLASRLSDSSEDLVGLLTGNFEKSGWMKVRHFHLDHHFSFGAFGDHHCHRDDVARDAASLLEQKGIPGREDVWVIGDTPADVQCARAIGARVLAVATGVYSREDLEAVRPDVLVDDFSDADRVVSILLG